MADGKVVPSTKVKSIQHLEGGIVKEILVREGDSVSAGQALMILEEIASGSDVDEVRVRINTLKADVARLRAAAGETPKPDFPEELLREHPDLVRQARELYDSQMKKRESERVGKMEIIQQRTQDIAGLETRIRSSIESLQLLDKQVDISKSLLEDNLTTEYKHLSFLREATALRSKIDEDKAALRKARSALKEAQEEMERLDYSFRETHREKLKESRRELDQLLERVKKFSDSFQRTTIRSPVDGIVKTLYVVTREGVVKPGMTVMDVVPASDRLVIESRLPVRDIGYVQPGQKAIVKLASRDAFRFGQLEGTVVHVSPDAYLTEQGPSFYTVRIETEKGYFEKDKLQYKLYPGVQVLTYIHTGWRTVFEYLMDPFLNTLTDSLMER
jgi:adhesin transport system membrane fusion protein